MPSSDPGKNKARTDPATAQARKMLRTLCDFMLPFIQHAASRQTINAEEIHFGIEADAFVAELENFISSMILRSRPRRQDIAIKATLEKDWLDNFEDTNWFWEIPDPDNETTIGAVSTSDADQVEDHIEPRPNPLNICEQVLRKYITPKMPIRLLCFEPCNSELKISLLDRAKVYDYLAPKLQADYNETTFSLPQWIERHAKYAILSHTWNQTPGELTYGDWQNGLLDNTQHKCQKLLNFCKVVWEDHGLTLGWIDTVCINKESSAELDESIRSMYAWYANARVCIAYLAGTNILSDMRNDPWFSRGWTLQELVAPGHLKFYNKDWNGLSAGQPSDTTVQRILEEINLATTITPEELRNIWRTSISRRMQLAAKRQVTREEDIAYCLMGIFDVSISTAYGEGVERAFFRLLEEILRSTKDISDIFNWAGYRENGHRQPTTSLFPSRPSNYLNRSSDEQLRPWRPVEPLTLTHLGLRTPVLLLPSVPQAISGSVLDHQPIGDYYATISISPFKDNHRLEVPKDYHLLDRRFSGPEGLYEATSYPWKKTMILTIGTLNVEEQGTNIHIPKVHLAVLLQSAKIITLGHDVKSWTPPPSYQKLDTEKPIIFDLKKTGDNSHDDKDKDYYELERSELAKHGMELVTLYL